MAKVARSSFGRAGEVYLLSEFLGGVSPDFRKGRMIVRGGRKFMDGESSVHRHNDLMNEFSSHWPDTAATDDFAAHRIREELYETICRFHDH